MSLLTPYSAEKAFRVSVARGLQGGKVSFQDFIYRYLSHYFTAAPSSFHQDLIAHLQAATVRRNVKSAYAGPRGSAKSTISVFAAPLWWVCEGLENYVVLAADTSTQANQHLSHIREELETNDLLAKDYPHVFGKGSSTWTNETLITRNNIRVDAMGAGKKIRGRRHERWRPTVVVIDDPENDEGARSPIVRDRVRQWLDAGVLKAGQPGTNFFVNGTLINGSCLMATLLERPGWERRRYQSIMSWPVHMASSEGLPCWDEWEKLFFDDPDAAHRYYDEHEDRLNLGAQVLWPERETLYDLMVMRAEGGHGAFEAEKQNRPINPAQCRFSETWFVEPYDIWYDKVPHGAYHFLAVDPSTGNDARKGDYIALIECAWKPGDRHIYVDGVLDRFPATEIIPRILNMHRRKNYVFCAFESNAFQVVFAQQLQEESIRQGVALPVLELNHTCDKDTRIERIGPFLQKGVYKFQRQNRMMKKVIEHIQQWPVGDHDDGPDALEMGTTCLMEWVTHFYERNREAPATTLEVA